MIEDKLKRIQECKKKDRKKKIKINYSNGEQNLIEIDSDCLAILDSHAETNLVQKNDFDLDNDNQDDAGNLDQATDIRNNVEYESEE